MFVSRIEVINSIWFVWRDYFKKMKESNNDEIFRKIYWLPQIDPVQILDDLIRIYEKVWLEKDIIVLIDARDYMKERISNKLDIKWTCVNNWEYNHKILWTKTSY